MWREEIIGDARLICADCREVLPTLSGIGAVVTDPPYGIGHLGGKWGRKAELRWDTSAPDISALLDFRESIIWGGNYHSLPASRGWLVWYKRDAVPSAASVELAWTSIDMNASLIDQTIAATNAERCGHPTQKPLAVMEWCIGFVHSGTILDPYMGSGTTGVASARLGRKFVGIEIDTSYFEMACRRIEQAQRQKDLFTYVPVAVDPEDARMADLFEGN